MKPYARKCLLVIEFIVIASLSACITTPLPPVAVIQCVQIGPLEFEVSASESYDPDGTVSIYSWEFGDGNTSSTSSATHRYDDVGEFTIKLTVMDNSGLQTSKFEHVRTFQEIEVPTDYSTIQRAIEAAENGDFISVLPDTYVENLDFLGKSISVKARGPGITIIQAGREELSGAALPTVRFHNGESRDSPL